MRNWYEAICEDLALDLIEMHKRSSVSVSIKSLREYKKTGKAPSRNNVIEGILALIKTRKQHFDRETLQDYLDGKHAEVPNDIIKRSCLHTLQQALESVSGEGIQLDTAVLVLPEQPDKIAEWIYKTISLEDGLEKTGLFLEAIRGQINTVTQGKKVRELHNAIAPLVIRGADCAEPARDEVFALKGVSRLSAPAISGLSILRAQGQTLALGIEEKNRENHLSNPENAVIEESFSAEDAGIENRIGFRMLQKAKLLHKTASLNDFEMSDDHFVTLRKMGEQNTWSVKQPFIYFKNGENYPRDQLQNIADSFKGFHTFAQYADKELEVLSDDYAEMWLRLMYTDLDSIEEEIEVMDKIRALVGSLSDAGSNEALQQLHRSGSQIDNTQYLEKLKDAITLASQGSTLLKNIPDAMNNCTTFYEKASEILKVLPEAIKAFGGS